VDYSILAGVLSRLEGISGRLEMTEVVAEFLRDVPDDCLTNTLLILRGTPFPPWSNLELGVSEKLMLKVVGSVSGLDDARIGALLRDLGDIGLVAREALVRKPQTTLVSSNVTVEGLMESLNRIALLSGKGSQDKKLAYIKELLTNSSSVESKYIVRMIMGRLRVGVGDGVLRDAIAKAFNVSPELVENAYNLRPDWGDVAFKAKNQGREGLKSCGVVLGKPVRVMLAQKAGGLEEALGKGDVELEIKYDGARVQVHKEGDSILLYTRRLEDVTTQFPEIVGWARDNIRAHAAIVEGEIVAVGADRRPLAFQNLSRRIRRKYDIGLMVEKMPVEINLFDIIYANGRELFDMPFRKRRCELEESITETEGFRIAENLVTGDLAKAEKFYKRALLAGHEGVMVKLLDAPYKPGSRVGYMYKVKPVMESLDLVVTGATWGEGRRARWLGSYLLSAYDNECGRFLEVGRMATGLTDEQLQELTGLFTPLIISEEGREVFIKPKYVFEVAYEEIQKSPTYNSGYALRFPRLVRVREDKSTEESDTIERIEKLMRGGAG
jgi:DNA ligase 1